MLRQPLLFWSGCLSIQFFNPDTLVSDLRDAMPRQRSLYTNPTPRCEVLQDAMPRQKSPIGYLGKRRISPGVISILSMHLRLHT